MMGRSTGCSAHRAALAAYAERSERGPNTVAAFEHLDRCRRCQAELTELLLTVHAVRQALAEAVTADPPPDAWLRLRKRVQGPVTSGWGARTSLAGVIAGAGLVAALIGPTAAYQPAAITGREPGPPAAVLAAQTQADLRAEAAFLSRPRVERPPRRTVPDAALGVDRGGIWSGPDGLARTTESVRVAVPSGRAD